MELQLKIQYLILNGCELPDSTSHCGTWREVFESHSNIIHGLLPALQGVLRWIDDELAVRQTFLTVVIGCGVHGDEVLLTEGEAGDQAEDLPSGPPHLRRINHLVKLRGSEGASERIAHYVGVKTGLCLGWLRRARQSLLLVTLP